MFFHARKGLALGAILLSLTFGNPAGAAVLDTPVTAEDLCCLDGLTESQVQDVLRPVEGWRLLALGHLQNAADGPADFRMLASGVRHVVRDESFGEDFASRLGNERLLAALEAARDLPHRNSDHVRATRFLADETISRQDLSEYHSLAHYLKALVTLVEFDNQIASADAFAEAANRVDPESPYHAKALSARATLLGVETTADYAEASLLMDYIIASRIRTAMTIVGGNLLDRAALSNFEDLLPESHGGSAIALIAAAKAASQVGDRATLQELAALEVPWESVPAESQAEYHWLVGTGYTRIGQLEPARETFSRGEFALEFGGYYASKCVLHVGITNQLLFRDVDAALDYLDVIELSPFPDIVEEAERRLTQMVEAGLLSLEEARETALERRKGKPIHRAQNAPGGR